MKGIIGLLLITLPIGLIILTLYAIKTKTNHFIPSGKNRLPFMTSLFLHDPDKLSGFFVVSISFGIWCYINLYGASTLLFSSPERTVITYAVVIGTIAVTIRTSKSPLDEKPVWSPENWSMIVGPLFLIAGALLLVWMSIDVVQGVVDRGEVLPFIGIILLVGSVFLYAMGFIMFLSAALGTLATTIVIAHLNFSLSTLALSILGTIYRFIDTGTIDLYAIPKLIHDTIFQFSNLDKVTLQQKTFINIYLLFFTIVTVLKIIANKSTLPLETN